MSVILFESDLILPFSLSSLCTTGRLWNHRDGGQSGNHSEKTRLTARSDPVPKKLDASKSNEAKQEKVSFLNDEVSFRWHLFEDAMAFDKLHEGIRGFAKDGQACKDMLKKRLEA